MADKQPKPTKDGDSSDTANKPDADKAGKDAGGAKVPTNIEDLPQELQDAINAKMAAARRDGIESGKNKAAEEASQQTEAERQRNLEEKNEFKPLYEAEKGKREEAEKQAKAVERSLLALEVAIEKKLPNPHLAAKRLIGESREELIEDANSLLKVLKSEDSTPTDDKSDKSKDDKDKKKGDGDSPPATSEGGDADLGGHGDEEIDDKKYIGQKQTDTYNW